MIVYHIVWEGRDCESEHYGKFYGTEDNSYKIFCTEKEAIEYCNRKNTYFDKDGKKQILTYEEYSNAIDENEVDEDGFCYSGFWSYEPIKLGVPFEIHAKDMAYKFANISDKTAKGCRLSKRQILAKQIINLLNRIPDDLVYIPLKFDTDNINQTIFAGCEQHFLGDYYANAKEVFLKEMKEIQENEIRSFSCSTKEEEEYDEKIDI